MKAIAEKKAMTFIGEEIERASTAGAEGGSRGGKRQGRLHNLISRENMIAPVQNGQQAEQFVCCIPLLTSEGQPLGAIEISTVSKILTEDLKLLDCFAVFASISIERSQLMDIVKLGQGELELKKYIDDDERALLGPIPKKLEVEDPTLFLSSFDAQMWDGNHIPVVFAIFDRFELQKTFNITNEKLFRFLAEIRDTYKKVPYHNWRHAVDVTQFVACQIIQGNLENIFTKFEILALIVSAICHDANHDGFSNVYNVKAETPLGILFKNQSVMETHHCQVSIQTIAKEECNIFAAFSGDELMRMWKLMINLILATDMARHFDILKTFTDLSGSDSFDLANQEHRELLMILLLKASDISNVARPFHIADKWCDVLCEEFFRQGDLEMANGMEYTSELNDKEHLDKPKSQIGFYTFVCLPLFQAAAKAVPPLKANVDQVESNLVQWKERTERNAQQAKKTAPGA